MKIESLIKISTAAHYSYLVESPYPQRGGLLLVAGPANMKSTIVEASLRPFPNALVYTDLTVKQLAVVRNQIGNGVYHTLGFTELEKIYARQLTVAMNFEGALKAMIEEGFSHFAFEDQRCWVPKARCFVYASVLDSLYRFHFPRWTDNGFLRRFLVLKYQLSRESRQKMKDAMHESRLVPLPEVVIFPGNAMPMNITKSESHELEQVIGSDDVSYTPFNLLRKVLTLLKWYDKKIPRSKRKLTPMETVKDLKSAIGPLGGTLEL